jgi:hypothetical protein
VPLRRGIRAREDKDDVSSIATEMRVPIGVAFRPKLHGNFLHAQMTVFARPIHRLSRCCTNTG